MLGAMVHRHAARLVQVWAGALLALGLTGCGGGSSPLPRASAPALSDDQARCREAARRESPLVTEWSAAEKAALQAALGTGGVAVEYTGCSMRPIPGCQVRGSYRWMRTTPSTDTLDIRSEDELFAKLPLGAFRLESELAQSGRLEVRTTVSGQLMLEGASVADVPDYGECARVTHLVSAVSLGAFQLSSGGALSAGASAGAAGVGLGGGTESSETVLREAGDPATCSLATDEQPDIGCSSPIQAFLVPLPRFAQMRGSGTVNATFASGGPSEVWEVRSGPDFVCKTPCTVWVNPSQSYAFRSDVGPTTQTIDVPDLSPYVGTRRVEVLPHAREMGKFTGGIVMTGLGGGLAFMGGFLALAGGLSERDGLLIAGGVTAGVGLVAIGPGIWLIASSGSYAEVRSDPPLQARRRSIGIRGAF